MSEIIRVSDSVRVRKDMIVKYDKRSYTFGGPTETTPNEKPTTYWYVDIHYLYGGSISTESISCGDTEEKADTELESWDKMML